MPQFSSVVPGTSTATTAARLGIMPSESTDALSSSKGTGSTTKTKKRQKLSQLKDASTPEPSQKKLATADVMRPDGYAAGFNAVNFQAQLIVRQQQQQQQQQAMLAQAKLNAEEEYKEFINELEGNIKETPLKYDSRHTENVWTLMELREDIELLRTYGSRVSDAMLGLKSSNSTCAVVNAKKLIGELDKDSKCASAPTNENTAGNASPAATHFSSLWKEKCRNPHRRQRVGRVRATDLVEKITQKKLDGITDLVKIANKCDAALKERQCQAEMQKKSSHAAGLHMSSSSLPSEPKSKSKHRSQHSASQSSGSKTSQKGQSGEQGKRHQRHEERKGSGVIYDPAIMGGGGGGGEIGVMGQPPMGSGVGAGMLNVPMGFQGMALPGQGYIQTAVPQQPQIVMGKASHKKSTQQTPFVIPQQQQQQQQPIQIFSDAQRQGNFAITAGKEMMHKEHQLMLFKKMEHQHNMSNGNVCVAQKSQSVPQKRSAGQQGHQKAQAQRQNGHFMMNAPNYGGPPPQVDFQPNVVQQAQNIIPFPPTFQGGMFPENQPVVMGANTPGVQMIQKK